MLFHRMAWLKVIIARQQRYRILQTVKTMADINSLNIEMLTARCDAMDAFVRSQQDACFVYHLDVRKAMDAFEQGQVRLFCDSGAESIPSPPPSEDLCSGDADQSAERPKKARKKKRKSIE